MDIPHYATFEAFASDWNHLSSNKTRMLWQLLDTLESDELLVELPEWLAEEKVGFVDGSTPTIFIGTVGRETDKAIRLDETAAARPLLKLANRLHHLDNGLENITEDSDRRDYLESRRQTVAAELANRDRAAELQENWLPKSQILRLCRRRTPE